MRKFLWLFLAAPMAVPISAQVTYPPAVRYVSVAPSGACSQAPPVQVLNSSGAIYTCNNGTWAVQGGGGGSGTVGAGTTGQVAVYPSNGTGVQGATALPNGITATTQAPGDNTTKAATDAFVLANSGGVSGLTAGFYPIAATASTLANGVIDQDVTNAGFLTIAPAADKSIYVYTDGNSTSANFQACDAGAVNCDGLTVYSPSTTDTEVDLISHGSVVLHSGASKTVSLIANNLASVQITEHGIENNGPIPTSDAGSLTTGSTNNGGAVTGLTASTTLTVTFAGGGFNNTAFCTASANVALATAPAVSTISKTAVTFTFPSLTGGLFYICSGS